MEWPPAAVASSLTLSGAMVVQILLVEDENHVRYALARSLEIWGHDVIEADTVALARAALAAVPIDLMVLDVNLPDATGWDVLRGLNGDGQRSPPAIVISAIPPSLARIHEFRPLGVLHKPFPIDSLRRLVDHAAAANSETPRHSVTENQSTAGLPGISKD